jgi:hypothetical protein
MNNFDLCEEKSLSIISCCAYSFQELYQASVHRVTKLSGCLIQHCPARLSTTTPRQHQITINMPSFNDSPLLQTQKIIKLTTSSNLSTLHIRK